MTARVPFFAAPTSFDEMWSELRSRIEAVMDRGSYSDGETVAALEEAVATFTGARHAVAVNNGTDALVIMLRALGLNSGDEIIVPCFTFVASASAVIHAGATPVFVDIDPDTYAIDIEGARRAVGPATKAIMPVHLFHQMADMSALGSLARDAGISVVEDSAEGIGMFWDGVHAGLHGIAGVLSFFPAKTLGAVGDAGMIITDDSAMADRCRARKSAMDEIQAAVLLTRLRRLDRDIAHRARLARRYDERLAVLGDVVQVPRTPQRAASSNIVYYVYVIQAEDKDDLVRHLDERAIGTEQYYPRPLHLQPCFAGLGYGRGAFPVAERACERTLALPLYPDLTVDQVDFVCDAIESFYRRRAGQ